MSDSKQMSGRGSASRKYHDNRENLPKCGREIEIFSREPCAVCECGFIAYNDTQSCIKWCAYARECVGGEIYDKFKEAEELKNERKRVHKSGA
jgi:hypothetical protein